MKYSIRVAVTFLFFSIINIDYTEAQTVSYHIEVKNIESETLFVYAEFQLQSDTLYMSPYGPMPERWDDYIQNISMKSASGEGINLDKDGDQWITDSRSGQDVVLSYEVSITHDELEWPGGIDGVAFVNENGYFVTGRSLFLLNGQGAKNISVEFSVPENWIISTPWNGSEHSFTVNNQDQLMESLIMIGDHQVYEISKDDLMIHFVLSGDKIIAQADKFKSIAQATMDYYVEMMGGTPTPGGNRSTNIMVAINESDQVDGEVIGGHISILLDPQSPPEQQMVSWFMFAHEFFHLWNGKTLQVSGTKEDWFKEGVSNYYTLKALYQIGFINVQALAGVFNGLFYQRYQNDPGLGTLSMRDAAEGFSKDNHWGLIYSGGLFAGIALDVLIREHTWNNISLDDVMRALYEKYSGTTETYSTEDIQSYIIQVSGLNTDEFFQQYIYGSNPIPIELYLEKAGFDVQLSDGQLFISPKQEMGNLESQIHRGLLGD